MRRRLDRALEGGLVGAWVVALGLALVVVAVGLGLTIGVAVPCLVERMAAHLSGAMMMTRRHARPDGLRGRLRAGAGHGGPRST